MTEQDASEKLLQMVVNSDLPTFEYKNILEHPDAWGVLVTTKHGKAGVASEFVKFLSNHPILSHMANLLQLQLCQLDKKK